MVDTSDFLRLIAQRYPTWRGKNRLVEFALRHVSGKKLHADKSGARFLLDLDNYVDSMLFVKGGFESREIEALAGYAEEAGCRSFVDIGAHFGLFTVAIARQPWCQRVHAFEPDPRNFAQLMANIFLNELSDKVAAYPLALSDQDGRARLQLGRERHNRDFGKFNSGMSSIVERQEHAGCGNAAMVEARILDGLLHLEGEAVAAKIDVENHEFAVLRGMRRLLERNRFVLLIETFPSSKDAVFAYLEGLGYSVAAEPGDPSNFLVVKGP
jgi:FkbM family methyltransferase